MYCKKCRKKWGRVLISFAGKPEISFLSSIFQIIVNFH